MSNASTKKVFIKVESVAEQQENIKNQRISLKVIQAEGTDKENLVGRPFTDKLSRLKAATDLALANTDHSKRKKVETQDVAVQTNAIKDSKVITVEDLTSSEAPSEVYWEKLAEKRRKALEETLSENQHLHERIEGLEEELNTSRQMLEEARSIVEVLTEMLDDNEGEKNSEPEKADASSGTDEG